MTDDPIGETPRCLHCGKVPPKVLEQTWAEWEAMTLCDEACRASACEIAHELARAGRDDLARFFYADALHTEPRKVA